MEDSMQPIFTIENGEKNPFVVISDGVFGLYEIHIKNSGSIPLELKGKYSKAVDAKRVVEAYVAGEAVRLEIKKRRKAVKVGKEKWAARKEKEAQLTVQETEANG